MLTVSLASNPLRTIELFGRHVLPAVAGRAAKLSVADAGRGQQGDTG